MLSLNVPVPGAVERLAEELGPELRRFDSVRERHTLLLKRFDSREHDQIDAEVRRVLQGAPVVEARVAELDVFWEPVTGPAPVLYFAVESPGLVDLHQRLVTAFGAVECLEGDAYTPHVTLARGGAVSLAERLVDRAVEPVTWTVTELEFWDPRYRETISYVGLPA